MSSIFKNERAIIYPFNRAVKKFSPYPLLDDNVIIHRFIYGSKKSLSYKFVSEKGRLRPVSYSRKDYHGFYGQYQWEKISFNTVSSTYKTKIMFYPWVDDERPVEIVRYYTPILKNGCSYKRSKKPKEHNFIIPCSLNRFITPSSLLPILGDIENQEGLSPEFTCSFFSPVHDKKMKCNLVRSQKKVKNLIRTNWIGGLSRHTTLTYSGNPDFSQGKKDLDLFQKRLNRFWLKNFGEKVKLLWVAEKQHNIERKLHFHLVIFNHHYLPEQKKSLDDKTMDYKQYNAWFQNRFWKKGFSVTTHKVKNKTYAAKYLTKSNDFSEEINKRIWSSSRGLKITKPVYLPSFMTDKFVNSYNPIHQKNSDTKRYAYCVQKERKVIDIDKITKQFNL